MFFLVLAKDKPARTQLRAETKALHMQHLDRGTPFLRVLQSGPLLGPDGSEIGSAIVVEAGNASEVEDFVSSDPYFQAGLFASHEVHPWVWRRGNPYLQSTAAGG